MSRNKKAAITRCLFVFSVELFLAGSRTLGRWLANRGLRFRAEINALVHRDQEWLRRIGLCRSLELELTACRRWLLERLFHGDVNFRLLRVNGVLSQSDID